MGLLSTKSILGVKQKELNEVNAKRKSDQERNRSKLLQLENEWYTVVEKNHQIEVSIFLSLVELSLSLSQRRDADVTIAFFREQMQLLNVS